MTRHIVLTTELLARTYDMLAATDPFRKWNLPDSEDVTFRVVRDHINCGWYRRGEGKAHTIALSSSLVTTTYYMVSTMAHEMLHLHEEHACITTTAEHSAAWHKLRAVVRQIHGFDS